MSCPSDNTQVVDQSKFWTSGSIHWDAHRVGWAIAGGCTALVSLITLRVWAKQPGDSFRSDSVDLCRNCPPTLSVCYGLAPDVLRVSSYSPVIIPNDRNSDRCTSMPPTFCDHLMSLSGSQTSNPVYATCICCRLLLFLSLLPNLHLLFPCRNWCVSSLIV
jgi:hypothetical protein